MSILDRYLAKRFLGTLGRILFALIFLVVLVDLLTHRQDNIIKYQIPAGIVVRYYLCFLPTILFEYHALAVSVLIAGLMVFGRAAQDNEAVAALAGGISLRRLALAPVALALLIALASFGIGESWGVRATREMSRIEKEYFAKLESSPRDGVSWTNLADRSGAPNAAGRKWTCHIMRFNRRALTGQDVLMHSIDAGLVREIRARRIYWEPESKQWLLEDGLFFTAYPERGMEQNTERITQMPAPFQEKPEELFALEERPDTKSFAALAADLHRAAKLGMPVAGQWVDYHAKFARPALCFIMMFLAIPFAMRLRRGGVAAGFGLSIAVGLAYLLVYLGCIGLGHLGELPPPVAAWLPNLLFLGVGAGLLRHTPT